MRIIFMGTPDFAVPSLDILLKHNYDVVAVVTSPDSFGGRGGKVLIQSAVKKYALQHDLPILQPKNLKSEAFVDELRSYHADIQIVVAFRMLPEVVWNMPPKGTYNLHGSLLPKYRGAAPIHHAIIQGEKITGVTSFKLKHEIDTGDILLSESIPISPDDNVGSMHDKMMVLGADVVLRTVRQLERGDITFQKQNSADVTKAPKIFHEDCQISFEKSVENVYNFIRGLSPYPTAWTIIDGMELKVLKAEKEFLNDDRTPGSISTDHKRNLKIKCTDGYISLLSVKPQGKREMPISDFLNGHQIKDQKVPSIA
ncbi:MAG: methionyl-tRNA formyltransferase [Saprospiraceae bacterium]